MKELRGLYAQTFFTFRTCLVHHRQPLHLPGGQQRESTRETVWNVPQGKLLFLDLRSSVMLRSFGRCVTSQKSEDLI